MNKDAIKQAEILSGALPYIQKYNNKIVVVKYGGNAMKNEELKNNVMTDICLLNEIGIKVVLVHGGGPAISKMLDRLNIESKFINGLRYTDDATMEVVQMVLAGQTNKELVAILNKKHGHAIGICGMDDALIRASKHASDTDLGYVGDVEKIHPQLLMDLLEKNYIPVVASVGCDRYGNSYNINADAAAASIAEALHAENMVVVSDIPGILANPDDEDSLYSKIYTDEIDRLVEAGNIRGGMIPKVESIKSAIAGGVHKACIIDGRIPHSLLIEILSQTGIGTMIKERKAHE